MSSKEGPIICNGTDVRAILEGRKTQMRRVVKPQPVDLQFGPGAEPWDASTGYALRCPYGMPGDRLWVRETWGLFSDLGFCDTSLTGMQALPDLWQLAYRVDHIDPVRGDGPHLPFWRPSIFMPRWASRITLEITGVKVERLQNISGPDCWAEGIDEIRSSGDEYGELRGSVVEDYQALWQSIHGADSWHANPWVWVIEFRRVHS